MDLSNCITDDIKTSNYDNMGMKPAYLYMIFPYFFNICINILE